jgi:hypothetical protein
MNLEEILANKELAIHKKRSEIQKSDFSNVLFEKASKAFENSISKLEVLVYEAVIKKDRNEFMFNQYKNGYVLNHSVGMRYVKLYFCYNNDSPEYTSDKENFDKYYEKILNKEDVGEYFWAVTEAKNIEGSAVVKGSNFLTPVLSVEVIDENTIRVKVAVSPANVLDSHKDVHIAGLWKKSLNENQYDLLLQEHEMEFKNVIVDSVSGDLKVYTEMISVKELLAKFNTKNKSEAVDNTSNKQEPFNNTQKENQEKLLKELLNKF